MEKYLIALDMDGTLINSEDKISPETVSYLKKIAKLGHIVVISSGRPIRGIVDYYNQLELTTPIVCYNGAYIYPGQVKDFPEYNFAFPKGLINKIIKDIGYDLIDNVILETNEDIFFLRQDDSLDRFFSKDKMNVHIGKIEDTLDSDTMTMLLKVKDTKDCEKVKAIAEQNDGVKLRFWSGHWYEVSEIYFEHINKANALKQVIDYYKIPKERVIAFGDAVNDLEMIQLANYGFAMSNAEDELKAVASHVTEFDNNHNGVIIELEKILKTEKENN